MGQNGDERRGLVGRECACVKLEGSKGILGRQVCRDQEGVGGGGIEVSGGAVVRA